MQLVVDNTKRDADRNEAIRKYLKVISNDLNRALKLMGCDVEEDDALPTTIEQELIYGAGINLWALSEMFYEDPYVEDILSGVVVVDKYGVQIKDGNE